MKNLFAALFTSLFFGCTQPQKPQENSSAKEAPGADSVAYTIKTLVKESRLCNPEGKTDTTCQVVYLKYPSFTDEKPLNDSLAQWLSGTDNPDKHYSSAEAAADGFLNNYESFVKSQKKMPAAIPWELMTRVSVINQKAGIVPLLIDAYSFMGGAHGNPATLFRNWDTATHKELALADLLKENYASPLKNIAETLFRTQEKLSPRAPLTNKYFFNAGHFSLNNNFLITPEGLKFLYNPYEIKAYAEGKTELLIPYSAIKTLIKEAGPLGRYMGK